MLLGIKAMSGCCFWSDLTIDQTLMENSKSEGGIFQVIR